MFLKLKSKINSIRCMSKLLLILLMLYPLGVALSSTMGYTFELFNDTAYASMIAIVAAYTVALSFKAEKNSFSKVLAVVAPISLITSVFFLLNVMSPWIVIIMAVCVGCCIYLTWISVKPKVLKVISLLLVALLILPIGFLGFIALFFGGIGKDTVIQSVPSPSGKYYAELIIVTKVRSEEIPLLMYTIASKSMHCFSKLKRNLSVFIVENGGNLKIWKYIGRMITAWLSTRWST